MKRPWWLTSEAWTLPPKRAPITFIAVMGPDETVKNQFIDLVSNLQQSLDADLVTLRGGISATTTFSLDRRTVILLNTPDHTTSNETEIYRAISDYLQRYDWVNRNEGEPESRLKGLLYIQHVADRAPNGGITNHILPSLWTLGLTAQNLAFVTTGWEDLGNRVAEQHEAVVQFIPELEPSIESRMLWLRHNGTLASGRSILNELLENHLPRSLRTRSCPPGLPKRVGRSLQFFDDIPRPVRRLGEVMSLSEFLNAVIRPSNPHYAGTTAMPGGWTETEDAQPALIAVMGATGSGKSTFINVASGSKFKTSAGLRACSAIVAETQPFEVDGRKVILVDTPGFDDTEKSDSDILKLIADFLATSYKNGRTLTGLLFFHRISDLRMGGVSVKNFRMFRKLCGEATLRNVVIVTNMWSEVALELGAQRERELAAHEDFFKAAMDKGAMMLRHENTVKSAQRIIRHLLKNNPIVMQVQEDIVDKGRDISETDAAEEIAKEIKAAEEVQRTETVRMKEEMDEISRIRDELSILRRQREERKRKEELERIAAEQRRIKAQMERERRELEEKLRRQKEEREREAERLRRAYEEELAREERWQEEQRQRIRRQREKEERLKAELRAAEEQAKRDSESCIIF